MISLEAGSHSFLENPTLSTMPDTHMRLGNKQTNKRCWTMRMVHVDQDSGIFFFFFFSVKGQIVSILNILGHSISAATT